MQVKLRWTVLGVGTVTALVIGTGSAGAVPTKGEIRSYTCGDMPLALQFVPNAGGVVGWTSDGAVYHVISDQLRVYRGQFTTEPPDQTPLVDVSQSYGNRIGQSRVLDCTFTGYNPDHNATAFEYLTVSSQ